MSLGLKQAGFDVVKAYDAWPVAVENYRRNVGDHAAIADLSDLLSVVPEIVALAPDMIAGGPPCQDFSSAGNRTESSNARLTLAFALIVTIVRPHWFVMENVVGCARSETWKEAKAILVRAGYGITESRIDAARYGVPQSRRRLLVVGRRGERDSFLASAIAAAASHEEMTLRDLFGTAVPAAVYFPARSSERRSIWSADEPAPTIRERSIRSLPASYRPHPGDAALVHNGFIYARPGSGANVPALGERVPDSKIPDKRTALMHRRGLHPDNAIAPAASAVLSIEQIARIQGFPPSWEWKADVKSDVFQMIANAVPAPLAAAIGRVILDRENAISMPRIEGGFIDWLVKRGRTRASARNVKAQAGRARRLLGGRTFSDPSRELAVLESADEFRALGKTTQSDLRQALRLLAEYQADDGKSRKGLLRAAA